MMTGMGGVDALNGSNDLVNAQWRHMRWLTEKAMASVSSKPAPLLRRLPTTEASEAFLCPSVTPAIFSLNEDASLDVGRGNS